MDSARQIVIDDGIQIASNAGWSARAEKVGDQEFEIVAGDQNIAFLHADAPENFMSRRPGRVRLPFPWRIAVDSFASALGCVAGHVAVLAPVGHYASPLKMGAIDAVVLDSDCNAFACQEDEWTCSCSSIGHTRCWVVNFVGLVTGIANDAEMRRRLAATERLAIPPDWMSISDTATLSEFTRDCGRADARFHETVVLAARLYDGIAGPRVISWLAVTDAAVSVALAEFIGAAIAPELSAVERFRKVKSTLNADLRVAV